MWIYPILSKGDRWRLFKDTMLETQCKYILQIEKEQKEAGMAKQQGNGGYKRQENILRKAETMAKWGTRKEL